MTPKEIIRLGQVEIRFLLDGDDTAGRMVMFEFVVPPGVKVPVPHYHEHVDEAAYGLEGVLTFTLGGGPCRSGPAIAASCRAGWCIISSTQARRRRARWRCSRRRRPGLQFSERWRRCSAPAARPIRRAWPKSCEDMAWSSRRRH